MGKLNSKNIGNSYERAFIKKFSRWVLGDDSRLLFWRNVHSGSISTLATKAGKDGSDTSGDFQCISGAYTFILKALHIDSKSYKSFNPIFTNCKNIKSNSVFNQWKKTVDEAAQVGKIPMMPVKIRDRVTPEFVLLPIIMMPLPSIKYRLRDTNYSCMLVLQCDLLSLDFTKFFKRAVRCQKKLA